MTVPSIIDPVTAPIWTVRAIFHPVTAPTWTVSPYISGRKSIYGPHGPYLKAPCCLGHLGNKHRFWEHVPGKMDMVALEIMSKQAIFSKWLPRPNHYAHKMCIEILCRTPVSILKYLSPRPQNHMKNSKYSFLA